MPEPEGCGAELVPGRCVHPRLVARVGLNPPGHLDPVPGHDLVPQQDGKELAKGEGLQLGRDDPSSFLKIALYVSFSNS